jgi:hypothetical protein
MLSTRVNRSSRISSSGNGLHPVARIAAIAGNQIRYGGAPWKRFRELAKKKWADGLIREIEKLTGSTHFTYVTAVTKLRGDATVWHEHKPFRERIFAATQSRFSLSKKC